MLKTIKIFCLRSQITIKYILIAKSILREFSRLIVTLKAKGIKQGFLWTLYKTVGQQPTFLRRSFQFPFIPKSILPVIEILTLPLVAQQFSFTYRGISCLNVRFIIITILSNVVSVLFPLSEDYQIQVLLSKPLFNAI